MNQRIISRSPAPRLRALALVTSVVAAGALAVIIANGIFGGDGVGGTGRASTAASIIANGNGVISSDGIFGGDGVTPADNGVISTNGVVTPADGGVISTDNGVIYGDEAVTPAANGVIEAD